MKPEALPYDKAHADPVSRSKVGDVLVLAKVRLNSLVVLTSAGGYYMAGPVGVDPLALAMASAGTALVAAGAAAINQVDERDVDRLMERTRHRPMADGRMSVAEGRAVALCLAAAGLATLWFGANPIAAALALATFLIYVVVYTPLKRRTSLSTIVGAVPGALPPLIGWTAARGTLAGPEPWTLFVLMFVWQLPHFLAISWLYRDDYARAGLPMLAVVDRHGRVTGRQAALWAAMLVPASLLPFLLGLTTPIYAIGALVLGILQLGLAVAFARHRSLANARRLFLGSILYLPLLWILMALARR
jgi:protoheme IX farnesyltransferase